VRDTGFLVRISHETNSWERYELRDTPAMTNQPREPRLHGWCGTTNNISATACGMVRVTRMARNGRALVQEIEGQELAEALEDLGYPDLYEESA
jgi:hypothetical protein